MPLIVIFLIFLGVLSGACRFFSSGHKIPVKKIVLENGFTALLVSRPGAPVFSAYLRIKVGNVEESPGYSGLAHFFEHMAFKGTDKIGTKDYKQEEIILDRIHDVGTRLTKARQEGKPEQELKPLIQELNRLQKEQQTLLESNEFARIYQRNGGADMNATTTNDYTSYFVSLPSNKLELWAYLESERLLHSVFREFYKERDVVAEERRMRYDNDPDGHLYEELMLFAFDKSPYRVPVIGFANEIHGYTVDAARKFRETYYVPSRMVLSIVGSYDLKEAEKWIRQYFGKLSDKKSPDQVFEKEDFSKNFPREKVLESPDEPRFYMVFHRPANPHPDDEVFDVLENLLCDGRTSRLYRVLVTEKKLASQVGCYASLPGSRLDGVFTFYALPFPNVSNRQVWQEILDQLELMKTELVTKEDLGKVINQIDAGLLWALNENIGLASMLTFFESLAGDWHYVYRLRERVRRMTPEDVQRVAKTYFVPNRRASVFMEKK
ncbi:MAG: hypothetical protein A2048_09940 [Deltaproteobacteria bacterium GWA2_45_12]|nr:MAG: hypothetical protein A2048_09940 [Deltaproteobacteria bacterium GWA2_45_12]